MPGKQKRTDNWDEYKKAGDAADELLELASVLAQKHFRSTDADVVLPIARLISDQLSEDES